MTYEVRRAICVECYDKSHCHPPDYNNPVFIEAREALRVDNAKIHAIVAMEHVVALHQARLLLGYVGKDDPPQKQAINTLMGQLCDAKVNAELKEIYECLKDLFGP